MQACICKEEWLFTGIEMAPHWAYNKFGILGDSIVAFVGPVEIPKERMIDLEEIKEGTRIHAEKMLHFIVEHFDTDLEKAILRQYLLISILEEKLSNRLKDKKIIRWGDDLYEEEHKLTVSAVTKNIVSTKIHLGINVVPSKIMTKTRGLIHYNIDPYELASAVTTQYKLEITRTREKLYKMRPVL